ncbi:MAG: DNA/RNA nuclease SfsA [Syntrophaceae bacterium]|nr:DNA/RNA nuclease SfsA [Syntrophaceae bacterium]
MYPNLCPSTFRRRLHRFAVECDLDGRTVTAHLPNPGRLWELLLPGRTVLLAPADKPGRTLVWTAVAVLRDGATVLLHTTLANRVVEFLIEAGRIPDLEGASVVRREATVGDSRLDFILRRGEEEILLEVKSCTLFGNDLAMFPDAVTERGRRHLLNLAEQVRPGRRCGVVWLVQWPRARRFLPDYHTDPAFAQTFLEQKDRLFYLPVAVSWTEDLRLAPEVRVLPVPWDLLRRESRDRGAYLLLCRLASKRSIEAGSLGRIAFPPGTYCYVGSARKNLSRRVARHLRLRKTLHWHIDHLRAVADSCTALPIRTAENIEHELARALGAIADFSVPRFGSSDCSCESHLFGWRGDPLRDPAFVALLQHFRMDRLPPD